MVTLYPKNGTKFKLHCGYFFIEILCFQYVVQKHKDITTYTMITVSVKAFSLIQYK